MIFSPLPLLVAALSRGHFADAAEESSCPIRDAAKHLHTLHPCRLSHSCSSALHQGTAHFKVMQANPGSQLSGHSSAATHTAAQLWASHWAAKLLLHIVQGEQRPSEGLWLRGSSQRAATSLLGWAPACSYSSSLTLFHFLICFSLVVNFPFPLVGRHLERQESCGVSPYC